MREENYVTDPLITVEENKKVFQVRNDERKRVLKKRIKESATPRCDFRIRLKGAWDIFVELKGTDICHALGQIIETAKSERVKEDDEYRIGAIVHSSGVIPATKTKYDKSRLSKNKILANLGLKEIMKGSDTLKVVFRNGKLRKEN